MRSLCGKAGRKYCVNVSRSVSICQSDPLAVQKAPGRNRQEGCFLEKWLLGTPGRHVNVPLLEHSPTKTHYLTSKSYFRRVLLPFMGA